MVQCCRPSILLWLYVLLVVAVINKLVDVMFQGIIPGSSPSRPSPSSPSQSPMTPTKTGMLSPPIPASRTDTRSTSADVCPPTPSTAGEPSSGLLSPTSAHSPSLRSDRSHRSHSADFPSPPTVHISTAADDHAIDEALSQKHKRRYIFRTHSDVSEREEEFNIKAVHEEIKAEHEACVLGYRHIDLVADGQVVHSVAQLPVDVPKKAVYVWDVMYENQRGISLWGKTWYSSNSLLPSDPSPFTLPLVPLGGEVMRFDGREEATDREGRVEATERPNVKRESINCGYNLETFQTPSPSWVWITPWMVKMRTNTDEQGWRYNLWFQKKGWRSHPGPLNWWGWVRRRAWVRLRGVIPHEEDKNTEELEAATKKEDKPLHSFDDVFERNKPLLEIIRHLATYALDREKQKTWNSWLENSSEDALAKLKHMLSAPEKLGSICRAFVFAPSRSAFMASLVKQNLTTEQCASCTISDLADLE